MLVINGRQMKEQDESLLEIIEKNGFHIFVGCRQGFCGACRCRLLSGNPEYVIAPLASISQSEILPCIAKVKNSSLCIETN